MKLVGCRHPVVHVVAVRIARTRKISPPTPPATPRPRAGPESSLGDTASGQKSHTQSASPPQPPWLSLPAVPPRLPASLPPSAGSCCAAQVSPAAVCGGRRGGQRGPSQEHGVRPARPRLPGRLPCSGPCASLSLFSRPPSLLVSEAIELLSKITETVL